MGGGRRSYRRVEEIMTVTDRQYSAGTVEHNATESVLFAADGKKSGHGTIAWLPAPAYAMQGGPAWPSRSPQLVIALLDTGVRPHRWLPDTDEPPFVLHAEDYGWQSPVPDDDTGPTGDYRSHWGHATFIAGLIRLAAPGAQVLSMRVMNSQGKVSEDHVAEALNWLVDNPELPGRISVDIVLMAFGRQEDPDNKDLDKLRAPIKKLTGRGVRIVASAGNDAAELPVYPAAFAAEPGLSYNSQRSVLSVGALATPTERAPYSNFGPWVAEWRTGTNMISIMPLTTKSSDESGSGPAGPEPTPGDGYAWWSGTSFAAATVAGELAAELPVWPGPPGGNGRAVP
jgi:subtilisin family serine protease